MKYLDDLEQDKSTEAAALTGDDLRDFVNGVTCSTFPLRITYPHIPIFVLRPRLLVSVFVFYAHRARADSFYRCSYSRRH